MEGSRVYQNSEGGYLGDKLVDDRLLLDADGDR